MNPGKVAFADTLRGVGALMVVVSHFFGIFWYQRPAVSNLTGLPPLSASIATPEYVDWLHPTPLPLWAGVGVGLFFLVSGFVIPFSFERYDRPGFLVARFFRLWPTYAFGVLSTAAAIWVGNSLVGQAFPYSADEVFANSILGLRELLLARNFDGIVWTLEIEIKFYVVAALIAPLLRRGSLQTFIAPLVLLAIVTLAGVSNAAAESRHLSSALIAAQFMIFMFAGVALNFAFRDLHPTRLMIATASACTAAFFLTTFLGPYGNHAYAATYVVALVVFVALSLKPHLIPNGPVARFFADISYPLYAIHGVPSYVVLLLLLADGWPPAAAILLVASASIALAYGVHRLIERPTHRIGRHLGAQVSGRRLVAPGSIGLQHGDNPPQSRLRYDHCGRAATSRLDQDR